MYNKLFTKILDSSVWLEPTPTRIVWLTFIAAMDENGFAEFAAIANVAHRARVTLEEAQAAIACLEGPDQVSPGQEHEGRRIERVTGGWMVLNSEKYRSLVTRAVRQEQTRERVRRFRERVRNAPVTHANESVTPSEAEAGSEADTKAEAVSETKNPSKIKNTSVGVKPLGKGNGDNGNGRSKRPIFSGQRFVVFDWQLDDLSRLLGPHTEAFDLHSWFFDLDARMEKQKTIVPQRDGGKWLQDQATAEARKRGLSLAPLVSESGMVNAETFARVAKRIQERAK